MARIRNIRRLANILRLSTSALALAAASSLAMAADPKSDSQLEEIVVTATKMGATALQSTPIAITALSAEQLDSRGIGSIRDLVDYAPGLQIANQSGYAQLYIRGVGSNNVFLGSDPSTTVHMDGVYLARPLSYFNEFLDVERIEILRGPQGTLYGRNSVGGTINVISRKPSDTLTSELQAYGGDHSAYGFKGYLSGPISGTNLTASIAGNYLNHSPYLKNVSTGNGLVDQDAYGLRGQLALAATDQLNITLRADYSRADDAQGGYSKLLGPVGVPLDDGVLGPNFRIAANRNSRTIIENFGAALEINYRFNDMLALKSLSSIRNVQASIETDADASSLDLFRTLFAPIAQHQYTEELNLTANINRFTMVGGLFFFREVDREPLALALPMFGLSHFQRPRLKDESFAAYLQGEYQITDNFSAIAGLRYTTETKDYFLNDFWTFSATTNTVVDAAAPRLVGIPGFSNPFTINTSRKDHAWTPKFGLNFKPNDDLLLYGSVTRGFKSGGYDLGAAGPVNAAKGYAPEFLWSYEVGLKADWLDKRLRTNITGFFYNYDDLQVTLFTPPANAITDNAATAKVKGLEFEVQARPVSSLNLFANLAYLDAHYSSYPGATVTTFGAFNAAGKKLNSAPKWSATIGGTYTADLGNSRGEAYAGVDYHWQSVSYFTPANAGVGAVTNYIERQPKYGVINARIGWDSPSKTWGIAVIGRNLADKFYVTGTVNYTPAIAGRPGDPRTIRAQVTYRY